MGESNLVVEPFQLWRMSKDLSEGKQKALEASSLLGEEICKVALAHAVIPGYLAFLNLAIALH